MGKVKRWLSLTVITIDMNETGGEPGNEARTRLGESLGMRLERDWGRAWE